jgi:bacteriorhodopsin
VIDNFGIGWRLIDFISQFDAQVGSTGVGALTIAFLIFVVAAILFIIKANGSKEQRRYYAIAGYICSFSAISYFAMLSGQGWIPVTGCRQLFWARYVEWLVTFPQVLVLLGSISGADNDAIAGSVGSAGPFPQSNLRNF